MDTRTWKEKKILFLHELYGDVVNDWANENDDRGLYVNIYNQLLNGFKSLPDEPHIIVKCAMNHYQEEQLEMMKRIRNHFLG